jgi:hypothetical protein
MIRIGKDVVKGTNLAYLEFSVKESGSWEFQRKLGISIF